MSLAPDAWKEVAPLLTLDPQNGTPLVVWECSTTRPSQDWIFKDSRITHVCSGLCVDVRDGLPGRTAQLWECVDGNKHQQFEIPEDPWWKEANGPRPSSTVG